MGFQIEFNWILKLLEINDNELSAGFVGNFVKHGIRIYPINSPIDLVNGKWEAVARCVILSVTIDQNETRGEYKIIEVYDDVKKSLLTEHWENFMKYSSVK